MNFYITTPIYYPSDKLHIGHSYTTVAADAMARYKKLRGYDVTFLTGTDDHGQKIERIAKEKNVSPKEYVDGVVTWIKDLWKTMDVNYDIFIRTTDDFHVESVQKIFKKLYEQGDIYKSNYEGLYCTPCETFFTERQLKDGLCPDCGRPVERVKEEAYFLRLSKYQDRLIKYIEENDFIRPKTRQNEMLNNFLKPGLEDLCVSRTSFTWGVPVDFDPGHVVYVWIDALSNYITALGYLTQDESRFQKFWPADVHLVGKEIVRFHTIIWPIMLMALDLPLPKLVFGHGWLIIDGGKMSKSKGNVVDPKVLVERYGVDAIRYFLLREVAFGQDGNFTNEALLNRINSDLANDLGNLLSRTVGMIDKYFGGQVPVEQEASAFDEDIIRLFGQVKTNMENYMEELSFDMALSEIWTFIRRLNKYADETQPWVLVKDESKKAQLANVMYVLTEGLRLIGIMITPFMPNTPKEIYTQLNINDSTLHNWDSLCFGKLDRAVQITKGRIVFPRIDIKKELEAYEKAEGSDSLKADSNGKESQGAVSKAKDASINTSAKEAATAKSESSEVAQKPEISIDDFAKLELKLGKVLECEVVKGSDKLLKSMVKIGDRTHQIVSGISKFYTPEEMVGKQVVVVTNLKPVKLKGILSEGMLLCASDEENLSLITVHREMEDGAIVR